MQPKKPTPWKQFPIGGITYKVFIASPVQCPDLLEREGITYLDQAEIWLRYTENTSLLEDALFHEILHAAFYAYGLSHAVFGNKSKKEERMVRVLTPVLRCTLQAAGMLAKITVSK